MRHFTYLRPENVSETVTLLAKDGSRTTQPLAGGTDLLTLMKPEIITPERLLDLKRLADLPDGIEENGEGLTVGTLTTLAEIEESPLLQARYALLSEAAATAATPQLRNMATVGGNLLQRPRCWYYRSPHCRCWLQGGEECLAVDGRNDYHAILGAGPCHAVHPSDLAPALLALEAEVRLRGPDGERKLPLADFFAAPSEDRRKETVIERDELLLSLHLPALHSDSQSTYLKAMQRKTWAFALVSVAAVLRVEEGVIGDARLALGGVAPIPWRATAAEELLLGEQPGEDLFARAAEKSLADAEPLEHNRYKLPLARRLIVRALGQLVASGR